MIYTNISNVAVFFIFFNGLFTFFLDNDFNQSELLHKTLYQTENIHL